jgi:hypothetical protein
MPNRTDINSKSVDALVEAVSVGSLSEQKTQEVCQETGTWSARYPDRRGVLSKFKNSHPLQMARKVCVPRRYRRVKRLQVQAVTKLRARVFVPE